jgi:hypothetical protein
MTNNAKILTATLLGGAAIFALVTLVDVDVTGDIEVPEVAMEGGNIELPEIETSGGEMPRVDVNTADVEFGTRSTDVEVPTDIEVQTESRSVEYPTMSIDLPEEDQYAEEDNLN